MTNNKALDWCRHREIYDRIISKDRFIYKGMTLLDVAVFCSLKEQYINYFQSYPELFRGLREGEE